MTTALIREMFYDYGAGKLSSDIKADVDGFLAHYSPEERRILKLFAYGLHVTELSVLFSRPVDYITDLVISALASLSVFLEVDDTRLYQRVKPTKHQQLAQFLVLYSTSLDVDLEVVIHDFRGNSTVSISTEARG